MAQPVIAYPGAKWRFYKYMVDYFPIDMKTFIEPFFGGGSVTLSVADDPRFTKLERMIGGDLYPEIWAMWNGIKQSPDEVEQLAWQWFTQCCPHQAEFQQLGYTCSQIRDYLPDGPKANFMESDDIQDYEKERIKYALAVYHTALEEGKKLWDWTQQIDTTAMTLPQRAARMILVSKISFSGLGDSGTISKDRFLEFHTGNLNAIKPASELLQRVEIYNVSFEETMKIGNEDPENSFIFLDPPYLNQESSGLYGKNGSTHRGFDHKHFADFTKSMKCKWFVTYDDSVGVRSIFQGTTALGTRCFMKPFSIPGGYTLAGKTSEDALKGEELFISNYDLDALNEVDSYDF